MECTTKNSYLLYTESYQPTLVFPLACLMSCYPPIRTVVAFLQGEIPYKIAPFFGIHRGPDEEQIVYD
jgi:hypothetical protein